MSQFGAILFILLALVLTKATAQDQKILFTIERNLNKDQIVYFLHLDKNGQPEKENPISLKWLDNEKTGELVPINWIKKKFGYGVDIIDYEGDQVTFKFVSYDTMHFTLKKDLFGNYGVFGKINGRMMKIRHIYLEIEVGSFWNPIITEVTVMGFQELANTV